MTDGQTDTCHTDLHRMQHKILDKNLSSPRSRLGLIDIHNLKTREKRGREGERKGGREGKIRH